MFRSISISMTHVHDSSDNITRTNNNTICNLASMSENSNYIASAGYVILGILMLAVAGLCLTPSTMAGMNIYSFRCIGGLTLIVLSVILFWMKEDNIAAFVLFMNGFLFVIAAYLSLTSNQDFAMILMIAAYLLIAIILLLGNGKRMLVACATILAALNLASRYVLGAADDGTALVSGIMCIVSAILFMYLGIAMTSEKVKLPVI